jgi:hypothetical protein
VVCVAALVALLGMPAAQAVAVPTAEQQLKLAGGRFGPGSGQRHGDP